MHLLLIRWAFLSTFAVATELSDRYTALLALGTHHTQGGTWDHWEYETVVRGGVETTDTDILCSLNNFEAFDLLPPTNVRIATQSEAHVQLLGSQDPALSMQLRTATKSWSADSSYLLDNKKAWANLTWVHNTPDAVKQSVNYFSFAARALPKLTGTTQGDIALPPLALKVESFLFGFWYRPGPIGSGEDAMLYTYGAFSDTNSLEHGFMLSVTQAANTQLDANDQMTKPADLTLDACLPITGKGTKCKSTQWIIPDELSTQRYGPWMHIIVGVDGQGNSLLYLDGEYTSPKCRVSLNEQLCTSLKNKKCDNLECASSCEVALSKSEDPDVPDVCTDVSVYSAFGLQFFNGYNLPELDFPGVCNEQTAASGAFCFHAAGISVLRKGPKDRIPNAVRFLSAPDVQDGDGVQLTNADGWFHDPVAMLIPADQSGLASTVADIRVNKGTYVFVDLRVTGGSGFDAGDPSASMTVADQVAIANEGKTLIDSDFAPVGLEYFPTAPLSCASMPHAAHVCAREASTTFFEDACFKTRSSDLPSCGYACLYDFNNDGEVTTADAKALENLRQAGGNDVFVKYPARKTDTNGDGTFDVDDVAFVKAWLDDAYFTSEDRICNSYFKTLTPNGAYLASGHPVGKVSPRPTDWQHGLTPPGSKVATNRAQVFAQTMCKVNARDEEDDQHKRIGVAYGADHINGKDKDNQGNCLNELVAGQASKLQKASERAFYSFGTLQDDCDLQACAAGPPSINCVTLKKTRLTRDFEAPAGTRRHLNAVAGVAPAATTEPFTTPETTSKSARRSLLRSTTRQLTANSPPPASPPSPPPNHPTLPSFEEWVDIISALSNGPLPAGVLLVLNGLMAVLSITIFQPAEDLVDAFSEVVRADSRVQRAFCAFGFKNICG